MHSQRAIEEAEDILDAADEALSAEGLSVADAQFRLEGESKRFSRSEASRWISDSVDAGYARIGFVIGRSRDGFGVVSLAAFEDPDSQFHP